MRRSLPWGLLFGLLRVAPALGEPTSVPLGRGEVQLLAYQPALEGELPRQGAYRAALDAVREGRYRRAREHFLAALAEVRQRAQAHELPWPRARTLMAHCKFEAAQAELLRAAATPAKPGRPSLRFDEALALHNLYLTDRAFRGRDDGQLAERAAAAYDRALDSPSPELQAAVRLGLTALTAHRGEASRAHAHLAQVPAETLAAAEFALLVAHAYLALGWRERALERLAVVRESLPGWSDRVVFLRSSNDFDALRDDPRFQALVGPEE